MYFNLAMKELFIFSIACFCMLFLSNGRTGPNNDVVTPVRAVNLGGWLVTEGWIKPSLFDAIPNRDFLDGTALQLKSVRVGKYLCAESGGGSIIVANRSAASGWETFNLWRINETNFNFRVFDKKFVGLHTDGNGIDIVAATGTLGATETFEIQRKPDDLNRVRIRAPNGLFLQLDSMVENFEGILKKEYYREDLKALTSQIRDHESLLRLKRRWLMDLPLSTREQKKIEEILILNDKILPESFLREDDLSYEDIRTCVETAFGAHNHGKEPVSSHEDARPLISRDSLQEIFLMLDAMTNKSLYSFAKILTEGVVRFEKTKWIMKRTITELLPEVISDKNDISKTKLKQISQLLQDPNNFHGNQIVLSTDSTSYCSAANKVLDGLEDFPIRALSAMHRKLRGVRGYIPSMNSSKSGGRDNLICRVRKKCMKLLSGISEVDERLNGALGVAGLTLKIMKNGPVGKEFRRFPPEIEALQNDIVKAIHLLNDAKKVSLIELKKVEFLLNPNSEMSVRSLRVGIRNVMTEYLYECSDMVKVPDCLVQTLDIINRRSQLRSLKKRSSSELHSSPKELMKEIIEKEIECVLCISAQAKEVVSNLLPEHEFDEEFARAYMEDYEVNDTFYVSDDEVRDTSHSDNSYFLEESIGETKPSELHSTREGNGCSPLSPIGRLNVHLESMYVTQMDSDNELKVLDSQRMDKKQYRSRYSGENRIDFSDSVQMSTKQDPSPSRNSCYNDLKSEETAPNFVFSDFPVEETDNRRAVNAYLEVQEACDVTSMIAYRFVGFVLDKLAKIEGLELYRGDRLYLNSYFPVPEDSEDQHTLLASKFPEMWKYVLQR